MPDKRPGSGDVVSGPTARVASVNPDNRQEAKAHVRQSSTETSQVYVSRTPSRLRPRHYLLTFAGCAAFMFSIAATGLVADLLAGFGGLVLCVAILVVTMMVLARAEGLL